MADFEGLIRQALARQNDADPAIREKVYQSSRKALARMIASAGVQPPDVINRQRAALEDSIRRIEAGYHARRAQTRSVDEPRVPAQRPEAGAYRNSEGIPAGPENASASSSRAPFSGGPELPRMPAPPPYQGDEQVRPERDYEPDDRERGHDDGEYAGGYGDDDEAGSTLFRRIIAILALIAILGVIGWLGFSLATSLLGGLQSLRSAVTAPAEETQNADPAEQDTLANASYITILSPSDTSALETTGRGKAEIVNQSNLEMVRLVSLRTEEKRQQPAPPILLRIQEGVLSRIAGNRVTVEMLVKAGNPGQANFTVGCDFAGQDLCGRKRFRVGIQPEAIVFTIDVAADLARASPAYLTISTDIAPEAADTGEGDALDLLYTRLRLQDD